ncbi:VWA domain-containing protein [Tunturiibacter gelidoferens]|uniref:VWFA-related protein n=3 Tax=Tunturiibacter TaxID=3154218 RepID=A0A7Y9T3F4_9BACT|nr:VWA domain-containing protein [Edaphobacter lichenicola]MBB5338005.1 VWFA-related protein [Edaphobacter lichenicola]NYF52768.1 VWFA-related protein [Edaphobacter lichenicola]
MAAGWLMLMAGGVGGWAQRPASPQTPAKQQPVSQQPSLTVDRDPVASPDPDTPARSQTTAPQGVGSSGTIARENGKYTLRQDAYEVRLNATVLDGSGRSIQTLDKDAFHIYEDGVPQTINSFRHEDLPVSLGLLIDSSGSMYDKRVAVDKASLDFVKLSNPEDEEFLVDFSWEAFIDQDFTNNIDKLQQGLGYIKSSGGTAIYDALVASADYLAKNAKHPKQVLLVITDGEDNASSATLEQTIRRIQDLDGPVIYCVGLLFGEDTDKRESRHARRVLETLAEQTGGAAYFPKSVKEVDTIAAEVAQDIRTQYTISYHSTKSPTLGGYREVHVEAKSKNFGRLSVRTRTGYYPRVVADASKGGGAGFSDPEKKN